jgi:hypothetical protein
MAEKRDGKDDRLPVVDPDGPNGIGVVREVKASTGPEAWARSTGRPPDPPPADRRPADPNENRKK